jgi:transposase InsO family protein
MKYSAIERTRDEFPVRRLCAVLGVSESGYYAWLKHEPSQRALENVRLRETICALWRQFRGIYGAPRIHAELRDQGVKVGRHRVARLMRQAGIRGKAPSKRRPRTTQSDPTHPVAPNLLDRQFTADRPNAVWLTDITYIDTDEGYLYLAGVMDLYSRQIVGLAMADHLRTELVETALDMAVTHRCPPPDVLHHSDRGSQYTSHDYRQRLLDCGMILSMSRTGDCLDNAPMESFWATLKRECAAAPFANHAQARSEIFSYIMGFYNRQRRHSALGYVSPMAFEQRSERDPLTPLN